MTEVSPGVSRRDALKVASVAAVSGAALGGGVMASLGKGSPPPSTRFDPFLGVHQQGITSTPLAYLSIAGFDVLTRSREELIAVLRAWTASAEQLAGASAGSITFTFGFGPSLFRPASFGIADRLPASLAPLPPLAGDAIDQASSHGDLCVQVCAASADTAHHGVRAMVNAARPTARVRWKQNGFRAQDGTADPRNLFGFRDGTANLDTPDTPDANQNRRQLWVDSPGSWLHNGTYLALRRIRLLLDTWDRTSQSEQEHLIGRRKDTNERLPPTGTSHAELASPDRNGGASILRRSYSYDAGLDPNGLQDAGLIFLSYQRDPVTQLLPVLRRLAQFDGLRAFAQHVATAVFAVPAGITPGGFVGQDLFT